MGKNDNIYHIFCGLGWPRIDEFIEKYPLRAINTEASEQTALDIAVGLAYSGKIPFVYTITPFFLRGFETIRTYINHEQLNVKLVGAGRDDDYSKDDGFSHGAEDIAKILSVMDNFFLYFPETVDDMKYDLDLLTNMYGPQFISIKR